MKLTTSQSTINRFNHNRAWKEFYPEGNGKAKPGYVLHHINPSWRNEDIERYISWNKEDLVMITISEHMKIHQKDNDMSKCHTKEAREKVRKSLLGNQYAKGNHDISDEGRLRMGHWRGVKLSKETCTKMSESRKGEKNPAFGRHWWFNELTNQRAYQSECPSGDGWKRGYHLAKEVTHDNI